MIINFIPFRYDAAKIGEPVVKNMLSILLESLETSKNNALTENSEPKKVPSMRPSLVPKCPSPAISLLEEPFVTEKEKHEKELRAKDEIIRELQAKIIDLENELKKRALNESLVDNLDSKRIKLEVNGKIDMYSKVRFCDGYLILIVTNFSYDDFVDVIMKVVIKLSYTDLDVGSTLRELRFLHKSDSKFYYR